MYCFSILTGMKPLVVKVPLSRRARTREAGQKRKKASERKALWRKSLRENPEKSNQLKALKARKAVENEKYKDKIREKRAEDPEFHEEMKDKQKKWKNKERSKKKLLSSTKSQTTPLNHPTQSQTTPQALVSPQVTAEVSTELASSSTPAPGSPQVFSGIQTVNASPRVELGLNSVGRPKNEVIAAKSLLTLSEMPSTSQKLKDKNRACRRLYGPKQMGKVAMHNLIWDPRIATFVENHSTTMPNKKDTILVNGVRKAKKHMNVTKYKLFKLFCEKYPDYDRCYTTWEKRVPPNFCRLDTTSRRVCICPKDYNFDQLAQGITKATGRDAGFKTVSNASLCNPVTRKCLDRKCDACGTEKVDDLFADMGPEIWNKKVKYIQWEQRNESYLGRKLKKWRQIEYNIDVKDAINKLKTLLEDHSLHIFRANILNEARDNLIENLPLSHAYMLFDFSENGSLMPQDEIEACHFSKELFTLHPIYIIRHGPGSTLEHPKLIKEGLSIISNELTHDGKAVALFMDKALSHIERNPGPVPIDTVHRGSDNCNVQYKSAENFSHLGRYHHLYKGVRPITVIYRFSEPGHGKSPSDGYGAATKGRLDNLIKGGGVADSAYRAYLLLTKEDPHKCVRKPKNPGVTDEPAHRFVYVPKAEIQRRGPAKKSCKTLKGTQQFRRINLLSGYDGVYEANDLDCGCVYCLGVMPGPCYIGRYRHAPKFFHAESGKLIKHADLHTYKNEALKEIFPKM